MLRLVGSTVVETRSFPKNTFLIYIYIYMYSYVYIYIISFVFIMDDYYVLFCCLDKNALNVSKKVNKNMKVVTIGSATNMTKLMPVVAVVSRD